MQSGARRRSERLSPDDRRAPPDAVLDAGEEAVAGPKPIGVQYDDMQRPAHRPGERDLARGGGPDRLPVRRGVVDATVPRAVGRRRRAEEVDHDSIDGRPVDDGVAFGGAGRDRAPQGRRGDNGGEDDSGVAHGHLPSRVAVGSGGSAESDATERRRHDQRPMSERQEGAPKGALLCVDRLDATACCR